ncbi:MAG: DUF5683 domain-containing protein [Bacteroidia bacterium]|nr:DUF5683 domain-containing protein [Bacteroidia bacterium]
MYSLIHGLWIGDTLMRTLLIPLGMNSYEKHPTLPPVIISRESLPQRNHLPDKDTLWLPKPRLSALFSAILPGAGQIYNRSYWKAPIIWGALGITGYLAYQNHRQYLFYRQAYLEAMQGANPLPPLRPENLRSLRESYRQDRDVFLLMFLVGYGLQIGEAYADAHLKGFTIYTQVMPNGFLLALRW